MFFADVRDVPCTKCSKMFVSERHMRRHFSDHHKERLCKMCNTTFENKYAFTVHRQKVWRYNIVKFKTFFK